LNDKITFAIDKYQLLSDSENEQLAKLKLFICREGNNLHNLPISWDTIIAAKNSLVGKPILTNYIPYKDDFGSHDPQESPVGCFINENDISEEKDEYGNKWLTSIGYIWKGYFPQVYDVLKKRDNKKENSPVSMEIVVLDGDKNDDGMFNSVSLFSFMGVTLLGSKVQPAIPNARATLNFAMMLEQTKQLIQYSYNHIDFHIPSDVKSNAQKGLDLYFENKRGGNSFNLSMARYLSKNKVIEPDKVKKLRRALLSKSKQDLAKDGNNYISFMLLGGKAGLDWCNGLINDMGEIDNQKSSYFSEDEYMGANEYGKGEAIKVDKSFKAMDTGSWGNVDKTSLRNKVLNASNYKTLVNDVYALVEFGWEDAPSEHLKYPIMVIKNGVAVYNRYGLSAALQRAEGQNESGVVSKINGIYKSLGLDNENKSKEEKSSMAKKMKEGSSEEEKQESPEEEKKEDMAAEGSKAEEEREIPSEEKGEQEQGMGDKSDSEKKMAKSKKSAEDYPEEEKQESQSEDDKEDAKMSLDGYADVGAMMAMLDMETEQNRSLAKESVSPEMGNLFAEIFAKVKELAEFKAGVEKEKMAYEVEKTMSEVELPATKKEELRAEASKFSLGNIDTWKNKVKAEAYEFSKTNKTEKVKDNIKRYALPFNVKAEKKNDSLWQGNG
jgi:hypothetical protein